MSRFQLRRAHVALAAAALLAVLACSKSDAPPSDSAKAAAGASAAVPQPQRLARVATASNRKALPGDLTKPIDDYTGDEFDAFVKKLKFSGGHERTRKCKTDAGCSGSQPTRHTSVLVDAVTTQDSIGASNAPQFGVVYVRAINKGDATEERYGMVPGKQYEYYMIIAADSTGTGMQWRLEQLDTTPQARKHTNFGTGAFVGCNHQWVAGARADFKSCTGAASAHDSVMKLGLNLAGVIGDPIWAECAMGCCIGR